MLKDCDRDYEDKWYREDSKKEIAPVTTIPNQFTKKWTKNLHCQKAVHNSHQNAFDEDKQIRNKTSRRTIMAQLYRFRLAAFEARFEMNCVDF